MKEGRRSLLWVVVVVVLLSLVQGGTSRRFIPDQKLSGDEVSVFADESTVMTLDGAIKGVIYDSYRSFQGIPFAEPPVGQLRWASPQPVAPWKPSVLDASHVGHGCPQRCILPPHTCPVTTSEDCLYLNIYTPRVASSAPSALPVMFFIPGGRFEQGDGGSVLYEGEYIANKTQTILVTTNYRLGSLGFLVTDSFTGNYGIQDQRVALKWIRNNIAAFGGDPTKITMFGQSAGATSTSVHLVSPLSAGLFSAAIIESNPVTLPMKTEGEAKSIAKLFTDDIGCHWNTKTIDNCLRNKTVEEVLDAEYKSQQHIPLLRPVDLFYPWTPVIGDELPMNPFDAFLKGAYNKVPIILGTVSEEAWPFIFLASKNNLTELDYVGILTYVFGYDMPSVISEYPPPTIFYSGDYRPLIAFMGTHYVFRCSTRAVARAISKYNAAANVPVYLYEFAHVLSFDAWGPGYPFCVGHVCHGSELPFVFHSVKPFFNFTTGEDTLSKQIVYYWTTLAHSLNPNGNNPPLQWPAYKNNNGLWSSMKLAVPLSIQQNLDDSYCNYWDSIGYNHGV